MSKDLDLELTNYTFNDLLNLFGISKQLTDYDIKTVNDSLIIIKKNINDHNIIDFYQQADLILQCIKQYREIVVEKKIDFKHYNDDYIFNELIYLPTLSYDQSCDKIINDIIDRKNLDEAKNNDKILTTLKECINEIKTSRVLNVYDNPVAKGDVNQLKRVTQIVDAHFNSCFRENYYESNPTDFSYAIPNGGMLNVVSMKLLSIEIPNCWFLFSGLIKNNKFKIEITYCEKCSVHEIVIPDGNYDRETLADFINEKYLYKTEHKLLKNIVFEINPYTNRSYFKLADCAPDKFVFSLHFVVDGNDNILQTFGWIIGFRLARYLKIDDVIQSEGLFDGGGDRYVFLSLNDFQLNYTENNIVCFDGMSVNEHILAKIPMVNGKFSLVMDENTANPLIKIRRYNGPVNIKKFAIKLLDRFGNIIDFNNMDWSFSIEFETLYENII